MSAANLPPELARALGRLPLGGVRYFDSVASTQPLAAAWAEADGPHLGLVLADTQTAGRGRLDRHWFTPPDAALAFSLLLRRLPTDPAVGVARLTALGAVAACQALEALDPTLRAEVKWPNDVLLRGRKVAGILVELAWQGDAPQYAILGLGLNVARRAAPPDDQVRFPATSLEAELGARPDRWELLAAILGGIITHLPRLTAPAFLAEWEQRLAFRGEWVRVLPQEGAPWEAQVLGLDTGGQLRVRTPQGELIHLDHGELQVGPPPADSDARE
jgi:BirA family biotin operon repressor/biotin-[acetyl-CoA-carboxylase] ligase